MGGPLLFAHHNPPSSSPRSKQQRHDDWLKYILVMLSSVCIVLLLLNARLTIWRTQQHSAVSLQPGEIEAAAAASASLGAEHVVGDPEIWALGPPDESSPQQQQLADALDPQVLADLKLLCGRCLYRTLTAYVRVHSFGRLAVVLTGDIPAMWVRDSAVQMATYLPRITRRPALRAAIEGAIRAQAYFILQDPWANAYNPQYVPPSTLPKHERQLGRGGWVWNRNFELDSVAYFFNFVWNYHQTASIWQPAKLLMEPAVHDAVVLLLKVLMIEQHHEQLSPYRYAELPRSGLGVPSGYTGMVWSAFRPSDDPQVYGYNIPDNMYLWGSLSRLLKLNRAVWQDSEIEAAVIKLMADIHEGINAYGVVEVDAGVRAYAYEVDGLGQALIDFDDPNLPSLLAMPLLGYSQYNKQLYATTRQRIMSTDTNAYYFNGTELHGLGSPHTEPDYVWPLATAVDALTTANTTRQLELLGLLMKMSAGNGLVHESVHVDLTARFSRPEFGWANAMTVVMLEQLLGIDCDVEAERFRLRSIAEREAREPATMPNGDADAPKYYEQLEAGIVHVTAKGPDEETQLDGGWEQQLEGQIDRQLQLQMLQKALGLDEQPAAADATPAAAQQLATPDSAQAGQQQQAAATGQQQQQQQQVAPAPQQELAAHQAQLQAAGSEEAALNLILQQYASTLAANA